jgi:hypothetical protein
VRLFEDVWKEVMPPYEATLKQLETALGDDHNLVLLRAEAAKAPDGKLIVRGINRVRKALQVQALAAGSRVYARKPRSMARKFEDLWNIWRDEPKLPKNVPDGNAAAADAASAPDPLETAVVRVASATDTPAK